MRAFSLNPYGSLIWVGFISLLYQVVLLRELEVLFFGNELIYILAIGIWLICTAAGSLFGQWFKRPRGLSLGWLFWLVGIVGPCSLVFVRSARWLIGTMPGAYMLFWQQTITLIGSLLPVAMLLGFIFAQATQIEKQKQLLRPASMYAWESFGSLLGGAIATSALFWGWQNFQICLFCFGLALVGAFLFTASFILRIITCLTAVIWAFIWFNAFSFDQSLTSLEHPNLRASRDTPYGRITLDVYESQLSLFENNALVFDSGSTSAEEFVHIAALQRQTIDSFLILGGGPEGLVAEALKLKPRDITLVELNSIALNLIQPLLPDYIAASWSNPNVQVHIADPRTWLKQSAKVQLILVGMPEPSSGQTNRFYTREFFALCADRLSPDGVLALRLRSSENLWTPQLVWRTASIVQALRQNFTDVLVLPGTTNIVLASNTALERNAEILTQRLHERGLTLQMITPAYLSYLYTNDRTQEIAERLKFSDAAPNTDTRPICYQLTQLMWLSKFFPTLMFWRPQTLFGRPNFWLLTIFSITLLIWLGRFSATWRRLLLAATTGLVGMMIQTVLVLNYQVIGGVLYRDMGILFTLFMAGMATGAWLMDRWSQQPQIVSKRKIGFLFSFLLLAYGIIVAGLIQAQIVNGLWLHSLLLLIVGFLVSVVFSYTCLQTSLRLPILYAADLTGGCLGALLTTVLLIPWLGLLGTLLVACIFIAFTFVLV